MTDWTIDLITAEEHERLRARYEPLSQAVRDLIEASIRTGVAEDTIRSAQAAIEAVTEASKPSNTTARRHYATR